MFKSEVKSSNMSYPKPNGSQALLDATGPTSSGSKQLQNFNDETRDTCQPSKKRRKKKKVGSKEERMLKRESDKLKEIYGPKDSHIKIITPEMMQKLKGGIGRPQVPIKQALLCPSPSFSPIVQKRINSVITTPQHISSSEDFPTLGTPDTRKKKNAIKISPVTYSTPLTSKLNSTECESGWETDVGDSDLYSATPGVNNDGIDQIPIVVDRNDAIENIAEVNTEVPTIISKRKPSKKPMVVSISALIESKKEAQTPIGKALDVKRKSKENGKITFGNQLDSSGTGLMNRGKIRETPKPKRPSKLKKAIMKGRALRKANVATKFSSNVTTSGENDTPGKIAGVLVTGDSIIEIRKETAEVEVDTNNVGCHIVDKCTYIVTSNCLKEANSPTMSVNEFKSLISSNKNMDDFTVKIKEIMKDAEEGSTNSDIKNVEFNKVKMEIHSKKFRPYCDMYTSKELHGIVIELMKELHRYQDRLYHSDPVKFKTKRRYILGLKDVASYLQINKLVTIIIAPDIELNNEKGGLDEKLGEIMALAREKNVRFIFSGNRYILGRPVRIKTPVSAIGILDFQGAEELHRRVIDEAEKLRASYQAVFAERLQCLSNSS